MSTGAREPCLPVASWFLYSEDGQALGQVYRKKGEDVPTVGQRLSEADNGLDGVIVSFEELRATCAMRRFKVVLKLSKQ